MDTKSKTHEANPQKGFVVQINASENFGLTSQAVAFGFQAATIPTPLVTDPLRLGLAAASHVVRGSVKPTPPAINTCISVGLSECGDWRYGPQVYYRGWR
jgi:hypothetical protein